MPAVQKLQENQFAIKRGKLKFNRKQGGLKFTRIDENSAKVVLTFEADVVIHQVHSGSEDPEDIKPETGKCGVFTFDVDMIKNPVSDMNFSVDHVSGDFVMLRMEADTKGLKGRQGGDKGRQGDD